jgi:transposase-like protein
VNELSELPVDILEELRYARQEKDNTKFLALVRGVKEAGWTFSEIAKPFEVSRSAANQWHKTAVKKGIEPSDIPDKPLVPKDPTGIPRKIIPDVPRAEREHVRKVAELARQNTRWSRDDSPERLAVSEYEDLIVKHVIQRKVPVASFARHAGVTRRAIMQRVEKLQES